MRRQVGREQMPRTRVTEQNGPIKWLMM